MQKLLRLTTILLFSLFAFLNTAEAAFPKDKTNLKFESNNISISKESGGQIDNKKELKKELKQLKKNQVKNYSYGGKSKTVAIILALLVGGLGIHSLYMGQKLKGLTQMGFYVLGLGLYIAGAIAASGAAYLDTIPATLLVGLLLILGVSIWAFIDFIRILTGGLAPEEGFDS